MVEIWNKAETILPNVLLNNLLPSLKLVAFVQVLTAFYAIGLSILFYFKKMSATAARLHLLALACLIQAYQYGYYCGYVDEVYVNLEHSWNLYHFGKFSFSPDRIVDGTVELLYYGFLSFFAGTHASLVHACMVLGLVISLAHTITFWYLVRKMQFVVQFVVMIGFAWNPIFAEIQGAGFGNGLVSLIYMIGFVAIWEDRRNLAFVCAAVMPAIRPDAVAFSFSLILGMSMKWRMVPVKAILGTVLASAFFLLMVRQLYGHWMLTPILYKKTPLPEIIKGAFGQLNLVVYGLCDSYIVAVLVLLVFTTTKLLNGNAPVVSGPNRFLVRTQIVLMSGLYLFYILSNRNFFAETRRYYLPFEYLGFLLVATEWGLPWLTRISFMKSRDIESNRPGENLIESNQNLIVTFLFVISLVSLNSAVIRWKNRIDRFSDRSSSFVTMLLKRENNFSLSAHLANLSMPENWRIATTELQGFGFLTDHDIDPLYGYANRDIALSQDLNQDGRRIDTTYLKRSNPESIWTGSDSALLYPGDFVPESIDKVLGGHLHNHGFVAKEILAQYPHVFILQAKMPGTGVVNTVFLIRNGLEKEYRESLAALGFKKAIEIQIDPE